MYNPAARWGKARGLEDVLRRAALREGWDVSVRITRHAGDEARLAGEACLQGWPVIVAVGGDGTVHGAANGVLQWGRGDTLFGTVPVGNGNDFARLLNLRPASVEVNLLGVLSGVPKPFDVGFALDEYFVNGMGVGFDAEVVRQLRRVKRLRGFPLYLVAAYRTFVGFRAPTLCVRSDEHSESGRVMMLEIAIGTTAGGGFRITPNAIPDDGLFDVCLIRDVGWGEFLRYVPRVVRGTHGRLPPVTTFRSRAVHVEAAAEPVAVHLDGELRIPSGRAIDVEVLPRRLRVLCAR